MKAVQWIVLAALLTPFLPAQADADASATVRQRISTARPDLTIESVVPSDVAGLYEVQFANGPLAYATADGGHFVIGDLFQVEASGFVNLAEKKRADTRAGIMARLDTKDMIVFPAKGDTRTYVQVFTDVDCFYCQKLHREVPALNAMGIEVRYLAYPRAGVGSDTYKRLASAWCAKDQQAAITKLKNREQIPTNVCPGNPVAEQYELGGRVGVTGTPALVTPTGELLPGYMPAAQLAAALGVAPPAPPASIAAPSVAN
ncbi:MAG TPA: DsbC family protein [Spongiibacteraceae bacterium]|nr:DsbC family protein [Spongiibacteraceae bacterium]